MNIWNGIFLGIVQGLTEFLPVSSSGHLVLFSHLFQINEPSVLFEVLLHVGTLIAVLVAFWPEFMKLVNGFIKVILQPSQLRRRFKKDEEVRLFVTIVLAMIPTVMIVLIFKGVIEQLFMSTLTVGVMLILTGFILFISEKVTSARKVLGQMTLVDALIIGLGQALALVPGISRSGTTIATGLFRGLEREQAARFSFLLAIPAITGALVLSLPDLMAGNTSASGSTMIVGMIAAAITGYVAIKFFLEIIRRGRLIWFSYYTWFIGAIVVILSLR